MSKTIKFYNIAIYKNKKKQDISICKFIDDIASISWENRVRKINDNEITAMFPIYFNDNHINKRIVPFGKFRKDYKPFIGSIDTSNLKSIKNDVVEIVTMLYDERYRCAILDYNMHGLKQRGIEEYLTTFLPKKENEKWEVKLETLISKKGIEDITKSEQIRFLEIKLNLNNRDTNIIKNAMKEEYYSITQLLNCIGKASQDTEANTIKIQLGIGNKKNSSINLGAVEYLFEILNIDNSVIESIKVRYKDNNSKKLDTIDLKNIGKQLQDRILENTEDKNPSPEYIGNSMIDVYGDYEETLSISYKKFIEDMVTGDLNELQAIPRAENLV